MTFGEKLSKLRKENNITQEQLAGILGVSRQAVSKWESSAAYPETEKMLRMCDLFGCSLDYLVRDVETDVEPGKSPSIISHGIQERTSTREVFGMPLWQTGKHAKGFFAVGYTATGVVAVGFYAKGIFSLGLLSIGLFSFGLLSVALVALGVLSVGLLAFGSFAFGIIAGGAICIGVFSMGALAIGDFSAGALAIGKYAAVGDNARAAIAIGQSEAYGTVFTHFGSGLTAADKEQVAILLRSVPAYLRWASKLFLAFL